MTTPSVEGGGELKILSATTTAGATNARQSGGYGRIEDPVGNYNSECFRRSSVGGLRGVKIPAATTIASVPTLVSRGMLKREILLVRAVTVTTANGERSGESEPAVEPVVKPERVPKQPTEPPSCQPADILPNPSEGHSWNIRCNLVLNRLRPRQLGGNGLRASICPEENGITCVRTRAIGKR